MSKAHRGRPLKKEGMNRGTCPVTGLTGVKLLYEHENDKGEKIKISKAAHGMFRNKNKIALRKSKAAEAAKAKEAVPELTEVPPKEDEPVSNAAESPAAESPVTEASAEASPESTEEATTETTAVAPSENESPDKEPNKENAE